MEIQWSLVLFTALTGMGGCMFACVAADEFLGRAKAAAFPAAVAALVIAVVGGLASVTHLSHPDRIMGALSHPTSGIFTEALLVGCLCVCVVVYLVLVKREAAAGARKAVAVIGAVFGVLLSFMAGESYLMEARPNWCSQLLPLGYLLTAVSEGIAATWWSWPLRPRALTWRRTAVRCWSAACWPRWALPPTCCGRVLPTACSGRCWLWRCWAPARCRPHAARCSARSPRA